MAAPHGRTNLVIPPMLWTQGNEWREKEREKGIKAVIMSYETKTL